MKEIEKDSLLCTPVAILDVASGCVFKYGKQQERISITLGSESEIFSVTIDPSEAEILCYSLLKALAKDKKNQANDILKEFYL